MTGEERDRRDSRALEPELITDPQAKAVVEARNGFRQYDAAIGAIHSALERESFKLRPSLILGLQREALAGISSYAGNYRPGGVAIEGNAGVHHRDRVRADSLRVDAVVRTPAAGYRPRARYRGRCAAR